MGLLVYSLRNCLNRTIKHVRKYIGNPPKVLSRLPSKQYSKLAVSPTYSPKNKPYGLLIGHRRAISQILRAAKALVLSEPIAIFYPKDGKL